MSLIAVDLPLWAAIPIALLVLLSAGITFLGTLGLLRFESFYERVHAPTLGASLGVIAMALASMLFFTVTQTRLVIHEILIFVFVTLTTPVTLMLLTRSALYRDRTEGQTELPRPQEKSDEDAS